ncbi:MAG: carbohydrate kinase family protein [Patescibacteria group bacterium]
MKNMDFVAVGDTVVDDFIKLKDAHVNCRINNEDCEICMRFGDKVPFESSTIIYGVGNAANAAVCAARLGLSSGFVSNTGADLNGDKILEYFKTENVDTTHVVQHINIPTNYHYVLWYTDERTILINHHAYPYQFPVDLPEPKTIYLSSLAGGTESYHDDVATYLEVHPKTFFAFQPGTFQIKLGTDRLKRLYVRADLYVVNKEEAQRVLGLPDTMDDVEVLAKGLRALGLKTIIITDDKNGAYALEGESFFHLPMYKDPNPPIERTGAGDAFASTVAAYMTMGGVPLKDAMQRGLINAAYVVQDIGAQRGLQKKEKLDSLFSALAH